MRAIEDDDGAGHRRDRRARPRGGRAPRRARARRCTSTAATRAAGGDAEELARATGNDAARHAPRGPRLAGRGARPGRRGRSGRPTRCTCSSTTPASGPGARTRRRARRAGTAGAALRRQPPGRLRPDAAAAGAPASARPRRASSSSPRWARRRWTSTTCSSSALRRRPRLRPEQARADHADVRLADELAGTASPSTSLHPATYMPTKIVLERPARSVDTLEEGVEATVAPRGRRPELEGVSGPLLRPAGTRRARTRRPTTEARRRLWEISERADRCAGRGAGRR